MGKKWKGHKQLFSKENIKIYLVSKVEFLYVCLIRILLDG